MPVIPPGRYTLNTLHMKTGLAKQTLLNRLVQLKKEGKIKKTGGRQQPRIYTISERPKKEDNGLFTLINRYAEEKVTERFHHHVRGDYTIEHALIDSLAFTDARMKNASSSLFRHVEDWTRLFRMAKKKGLQDQLRERYEHARAMTKVKRMPRRYQK